jgi:hypothetical protein
MDSLGQRELYQRSGLRMTTDEMDRNLEVASLLGGRYYLILNNIQIELDDEEVDEAVDKVMSRTGNIVKVDFGKEQ